MCDAPRNEKIMQSKVRRFAARLIDLNGDLASFLGSTLADEIGVTEFNEIYLTACLIAGQNKPML